MFKIIKSSITARVHHCEFKMLVIYINQLVNYLPLGKGMCAQLMGFESLLISASDGKLSARGIAACE